MYMQSRAELGATEPDRTTTSFIGASKWIFSRERPRNTVLTINAGFYSNNQGDAWNTY